MEQQQQSLVRLHIAVLLFSGTALFAKLIAQSALDITAYRAGIAAICLIAIHVIRKQRLRLFSLKDYAIAITLGVLVGMHWVTYFASMQYSSVAIGMIAFFTYPVMTVFLEPLLDKQAPKLMDVFIAIWVLAGIALLLPDFNLENDTSAGIFLGVISALFFALRNLLHKRKFSHYSGPQAMAYQTLVASAMLLPFVEQPIAEITQQDAILLIVVGILFTALPHALFAGSLRFLPAKTVGLVSCMQPLYATVLAAIFLAEKPDLITLIGGTMVVSAALYETRKSRD